uniref:Dystrophin n=1 Tax=Meloidogyne javanica TaxID=6303 RepID=A0A915LN16_MELJA
MDTSGQMQLLQLSADELRKSLPPTMCEQQIGGDVLDQLNQKLHEIESRVQSALLRALQYRQDEDENIEINEEEGRKEELWQPEFDANVSTSSTAQQVFVPYPSEEQQLETKYKVNIDGIASTSEPVKEFSEDEYIEEKKGGNIGMSQRTGAKLKEEKMKSDGQQFLLKRQQKIGEQTGGMDRFYISLNIMEDYIEQQQQLNALPYETFTEKAEMLKDFEMELERGEQLLNEHLMTMEVGESEHVKARIASLRRHFEEKKLELESRRETIRALEQHYSQCEQMLDELANICKEPRIRLKGIRLPKNEETGEGERINLTESRDPSPDLDELEAAQAQLENYLPPIAVRLQQIQNRLNVLSEHLSAAAHNKFQQKLRLLVEDFNERTKEVRIKRDQLEIRLADQTHLKQLLDDLEFWCDESEAILETVEQIGPLNILKIEKEEENIQKRYYSTETKLESFRQLERLKDRFANLVSVEPQVKHEVRIKLKERMDNLLAEKWSADELWREFAALKQWAEAAEKQIYAVENAKIFRPSLVNIENLAGKLNENRLALQNIQQRLNQQAAVVQNEGKNIGEVERGNLKLIQNQQNGFHSPLENFGQENGHLIEYRTLSTQSDGSEENIGDESNLIPIINPEEDDKEVNNNKNKYPRRKMSLADQSRLDTEVERDIATSVDLSDQSLIRQALGKMQNFVDDIQINQLEIIKVLDEAKDKLIIERTQICSAEMERILGLCKRRKGDLQKLLEQCRLWEQLRASLELWLNQANEKLTSGGRIIGLSDDELSEQLDLINQLTAESDQWEEKLREMNRISNQLLEIYRRDDGHNLSHLNSKLNTQWAKFNDQLRIRRSVIEAAQRSRFDFQTALGHFQQWMQIECLKLQKLANETENQQKLKDTGLRNEWLGKEKSAKREILLKRVESIESEWNALLSLHKIIKERLENAQEECDRLIQSLSDFLFWVDQQRKTIANTQPVGGDLNTVERQCGILRTIQRGIEAREQPVEECIKLAHEFLMQHNLRPPIHHPSLMAQPPVDPYSPKTEAEREERRVGQQINSDSKQLQENWAILKEELTICYQKVADTHKEMQELDRSMAEALLSIGTVEGEIQTMRPVENLLLEDLNLEKVECLEFRQRVHEAGTHVDDVNNWASSIQAMGIELSDQLEHHIIAINERYEKLKRDIGCRWAALERALNDFGPASENFLVDLVEPPWQRAISTTNRLPYYIE